MLQKKIHFLKTLFYLLVLTSIVGCNSTKKSCYRNQIINHEFKDISELTKNENATYNFTDTSQTTFQNGAFYAEAAIVWRSFSEYDLIVRKVNYTNGVKVGDTVKVKVLTQKADTFY